MKAVAVIPARGGSKSIPYKSIAPLLGKPLLAWSIEAARGCRDITRIIVSSDDPHILSVAREYGAEALERPAELATDTARSELTLEHALRCMRDQGELPAVAVYLQPTSPLRAAAHISEALAHLQETGADALISVFEADKKFLKAFVFNDDGFLRGLYTDQAPFSNRQSLPSLLMPNGAIYIVRPELFLAQPTFLPRRTVPFIMAERDSIDIDTTDDLRAVEKILSTKR